MAGSHDKQGITRMTDMEHGMNKPKRDTTLQNPPSTTYSKVLTNTIH